MDGEGESQQDGTQGGLDLCSGKGPVSPMSPLDARTTLCHKVKCNESALTASSREAWTASMLQGTAQGCATLQPISAAGTACRRGGLNGGCASEGTSCSCRPRGQHLCGVRGLGGWAVNTLFQQGSEPWKVEEFLRLPGPGVWGSWPCHLSPESRGLYHRGVLREGRSGRLAITMASQE